LEHALGWRIHPSLDVPCFLLVEGIKDYVFWKALFAYFKNLKVLVIPCGSVRKISNEYLHLRGFYPDQKILICIDNDKAGKDVKKDFLNNVIAKGSKPTKEDQEMLKEVFFTYADLPSDDLKVIDLEDYIKSLCPKLKKDGKKTLAYKFKQEIEKPNNDISNIQQIESFLKEKYDSVTF
jgi:5S rRNA maturation endonuclease (ribonuclease M5)